ncbi:MAG: chloride channel protein [Gammaproteobacteria bacterium]|nr:chloride channel protein [Pseudomonadales bacterium]MCP5348190.1 chloride channel protein [Pseudomonadales bacterium]
MNRSLREKSEHLLEVFRTRISYQDALPQLLGLGIVSGLSAALLVVVFRLQVEGALAFLFHGAALDFESLDPVWRFLFPFLGALLLGLALTPIDQKYQSVGVFHVLERLRNHQGRLPGRNLLVQFFGGTVALISGQSIGREGPGVHLGAGIASLLGQWFDLPNNAIRTLIACGAAAAISAAFNTPMAGVIFAMEVILMEYTMVGFIPVIIASVLGSTVSQLVFGADSLIVVPPVQLNLLWEIPFMICAGLLYALAALAFIRVHLTASRWRKTPVLIRYLLMGSVTGAVAVFLPQILGAGYDTLNLLIAGQVTLGLLIAIVIAKLVITAAVTGLGMVGGLIGPLLVIGGCLGGVLGVVGNGLVEQASSPGFYVVLGMVAMLGAVLNAPMAALVTILELSNNPAIIFPSMLMVVVACVAVQQLFHTQGIFAEQLRSQGVASYEEPARQFLSRIGVRSVMNTSLTLAQAQVSEQQARELVKQAAVWIVIRHAEGGLQVISTADLVKHLERLEQESTDRAKQVTGDHSKAGPVDLTHIAAQVFDAEELDSRSNLYQASLAISQDGVDALCVTRRLGSGRSVVGILTRDSIRNYYGV